ncbi:MAG: PaaI family thioesterase [Hyphomicrobiales bacterium]|nr:PaaI family thioesterase [Hyphomicrobiales bacterium]
MSVALQPNPNYTLVLNKLELSEYVKEVFPQADSYQWKVEQLVPGSVAVSMQIEEHHLRPGGTVSGPTMFALADVAAYLVILGHIGKVALAVTTSLNINFLSKPPHGNLMARCDLIKLGKRLAICELHIIGVEDEHIVAQATVTYSIPPRLS